MLDAAYQTQLTHNPEVTPSASCDVTAAAAGPERRGIEREGGTPPPMSQAEKDGGEINRDSQRRPCYSVVLLF